MQPRQVTSFEHLLDLLSVGQEDFFIGLKGGLRSSVMLFQHDEDLTTLTVLNEIDGTTQILTKKQLYDEDYTNIGKALDKGGFYYYDWKTE